MCIAHLQPDTSGNDCPAASRARRMKTGNPHTGDICSDGPIAVKTKSGTAEPAEGAARYQCPVALCGKMPWREKWYERTRRSGVGADIGLWEQNWNWLSCGAGTENFEESPDRERLFGGDQYRATTVWQGKSRSLMPLACSVRSSKKTWKHFATCGIRLRMRGSQFRSAQGRSLMRATSICSTTCGKIRTGAYQ